MPGRITRITACALTIALVGCSRDLSSVLTPNQPPQVTVSGRSLAGTPDTYAWQVQWRGTDLDGRVVGYRVALDPPSLDRVDASWQSVDGDGRVIAFPTREALRRLAAQAPTRSSHVLAVRAEDDRGGLSEPQWFAFAEGNLPPVVVITNPHPSPFVTPSALPAVEITWQGSDPDGQFTNRPVRYCYRLFSQHNPDRPDIPDFIAWSSTYPDSLRALYSPGFDGWQSSGPDTTSTSYSNLIPNQTYMFVVTGFDEAGDDDPVYSRSKNMLVFHVIPAGTDIGPILTMFNESFFYQYPTGGFRTDESRIFDLSQPADRPITLNWFADPLPGVDINAYRWTLDIEDLEDETPRIGPGDVQHWSVWSPNTTSATIGPLPPSKETPHYFYIEVRDQLGLISLGIIRFATERATPTHELLIVDDTRFMPDQFLQGVLDAPRGPWPVAAELDTFLYAVGGVPWRGYPAGTTTTPGLFAGYAFDTLGTRRFDPVFRPRRPGVVTAAELGQYRHVIWLTDLVGATYTGNPASPVNPPTSLRTISRPGQVNELATYVAQGGKLWLAGGGAAYASLVEWNARNTTFDVYSSETGELGIGRTMYDLAHWRSEIRIGISGTSAPRSPTPGRGWPGQPDYGLLPTTLARRTPATDPLPPRRTNPTWFYPADFHSEVLTLPNEIVEGDQSTLDTLYDIVAPGGVPLRPGMTYYHGPSHAPVVFSGFGIWEFQRTHCQALVDFVLQQVWGISHAPPAPRPGGATTGRAPDGSGKRVARARAPDGGATRP